MRCTRTLRLVDVLSLGCLLACMPTGRAAGESGDGSGKPMAKSPAAVLKGLHNTGGVGFAYSQGDQADQADDHTLAPYFYVAGGNPAPGFREQRRQAHRGGVRVPGLDPGRCARHAHEDWRAHHRGPYRAQARGTRRVRGGQARRPASLAAGTRAAQCLHHQRRQHHAGRPHRGGTGLQRDDPARQRHLRICLSDGGGSALRRRGQPQDRSVDGQSPSVRGREGALHL